MLSLLSLIFAIILMLLTGPIGLIIFMPFVRRALAARGIYIPIGYIILAMVGVYAVSFAMFFLFNVIV